MFKWIRTMIMKGMMTYKGKHTNTDVLMWKDDDKKCEFALTEEYSESDRKRYRRFIVVTIKEYVKEVER